MRCFRLAWLLLGILLFSTALAGAVGSDTPAPGADPELEARVQRVSQELRCLVCQNQTIADSNADLAVDLRREVRQMLSSGASEAEVRSFMVERYGEFVLYRPPFQMTTLALWLGPFLLLLTGIWIARRIVLTRRQTVQAATALDPADEARLRSLVGNEEPGAR
jgi:cytochrome c-type biogenesis protein CcmH